MTRLHRSDLIFHLVALFDWEKPLFGTQRVSQRFILDPFSAIPFSKIQSLHSFGFEFVTQVK